MNVSLPDSLKAWVEAQMESGTYANASEYICDLIRKDQQRKDAIAALRTAIQAGAESGEAGPFDAETFKLRLRGRRD